MQRDMAESGSKLIHQMTFALMRVSVSRFTKCHAPKVTSCLAVPGFPLHSPHYPGQAELFAFLNLFLASFRPLSLCQSVCLSSLAQLWRQSRLPAPPFPLSAFFGSAFDMHQKLCQNLCTTTAKKKRIREAVALFGRRFLLAEMDGMSSGNVGASSQKQATHFSSCRLPSPSSLELVVPFLCGCGCCGQSLCVFLGVWGSEWVNTLRGWKNLEESD